MSPENELVVSGYFENLSVISDFMVQAATAAGLDDRAVYAVQMAVDEACTNIIEHAYGGEGRGSIRLVYEIQPDGFQVIIYDQGQPFDPAQVPEFDPTTPLDQRVKGGMGLFLIRRSVDRVEFKFGTPHGNQLLLFKQCPSPP
jgi:anti-sigma regulatory factor (Ser/Thr protein kinase)